MTRPSHLGQSDRLPTTDGWAHPGSKATTEAARKTADNVTVVPLGSGGLQIELHAGGADVEIEVNSAGKVISVFWVDADAPR